MKRALIIANNYPDTDMTLRGCVNDAYTMEGVLKNHYGFDEVKLLLDKAATHANMLAELNALVDGAQVGDTVYFHYSGHGTYLPNNDPLDPEPDGHDECIVPYDLNWSTRIIRDDDLKKIFDKLPNGVELTVTLDSCNSGGGLDQLNEYQPLATKEVDPKPEGRFITPPGHKKHDKPKFKKDRFIQSATRDVNINTILMTGCQAEQTSADAYINGKYQGAFTYALAKTLADNSYAVSNIKTIEDVNKFMVTYGFTQRPQMDGPSSLFVYDFLGPRDSQPIGVEPPVVEEPVTDAPVVEEPAPPAAEPIVTVQPVIEGDPLLEESSWKDKLPLIIGGVIVVALLVLAFS